MVSTAPARRFDAELEALYQWGHISASTFAAAATRDVHAGFFHAEMGYTFGEACRRPSRKMI